MWSRQACASAGLRHGLDCERVAHDKQIGAGGPETCSADILADNLKRLRALFPEAFKEAKVERGQFEYSQHAVNQSIKRGIDERELREAMSA